MAMVSRLSTYPNFIMQPLNSASVVMDATGERVGCCYQIRVAGNIAKVHLYSRTATTPDTVKVSLQSVGTDGNPSGTILGATNKAYGTVEIAAGATWYEITLTEVAAVTAGQWIALVIEFESYDSGNISFYFTMATNEAANEYAVTDITASPGTWAKASTTYQYNIAHVIEYSSTVFHPSGLHYGGPGAALSISTSTNPDEAGIYFQVPNKMRAYGVWVYADLDYEVTLVLRNSSDTILANIVVDPDYRSHVGYRTNLHMFDADPASNVTLVTGTWYRLTLVPSTTSNVSLYYCTMPSAASMAVLDGGTLCYATHRTDGGAWTQTDTRRYLIGLLVDQYDDGAGGSGGGGLPILGGSIVR